MTKRQVETLAAAWHGGVFVGVIGCLLYNWFRRKFGMAVIYLAIAGIEAKVITEHVNDAMDGRI